MADTQNQQFSEITVDDSLSIEEPPRYDPIQKAGLQASLRKKNSSWNVESWSHTENNIIQGREHGFVHAVRLAFALHHPLCFSPDDIWTLVLQGVSEHIKSDPEAYRNHFVDFAGKKTLTIIRNEFVKGRFENDWAGCFNEWADQIQTFIGEDNINTLNPKFSTTGPLATAVHNLGLMDCMKAYFTYECRTLCGISRVKLLGSKEDWDSLVGRVEALKQYTGMEDWIETLIPVMQKLADAYGGEVDKKFWQHIYKYHSPGGSGAVPTVDGWITLFFPFLKSKKVTLRTLDEIYRLSEQESNTSGRGRRFCHKGPGIQASHVPLGISETAIRWDYLGNIIPMTAYCGFMGCQMTKDGFVKPLLGWAMGEEVKKEETGPRRGRW